MKKRLNNKGYMLIEIILASVIAMTVAYFLMELTIKLKNKNDDILVKTLTYTDQAIIYNKVMEYLIDLDKNGGSYNFTCGYIDNNNDIKIIDNKITIDGFTTVVNEYATVGAFNCTTTYDHPGIIMRITIPIDIPQLPDEDFNIEINYSKKMY